MVVARVKKFKLRNFQHHIDKKGDKNSFAPFFGFVF
jgi:hypothetical protein